MEPPGVADDRSGALLCGILEHDLGIADYGADGGFEFLADLGEERPV